MKLGVEVFSSQKFHGGGQHFWFNYGYCKQKTIDESPNHAVTMIHMERLWDDAIHLDQLLGGAGDFGRRNGLKHSHGSKNYTAPHSAYLGVPNTVFLCCLISKDRGLPTTDTEGGKSWWCAKTRDLEPFATLMSNQGTGTGPGESSLSMVGI
jgi:hypothetical protein